MVDMSGYNGIHLTFPSWSGMLPAQGSVPAQQYHNVVTQWAEALKENAQLRERIAVLERQVAERGM